MSSNHPRHRSGTTVGSRAIIAALAIALTAGACSRADTDDDSSGSSTPQTTAGRADARETPITYNEAKALGKEGDYTWSEHCDTSTGRLKMPLVVPLPCVPVFEGDNGGDTGKGVTADSITVARYAARPDPQSDALTKSAGAYDTPEDVAATYEGYNEIYASLVETYGRRVELVQLDGTGAATDDVPARADADNAADGLDAFGVLGGPNQTRAFAQQLARKGVLCIGNCLIAQPESFYEETAPYVWVTGPSPNQTSAHTREFILKQLAGKNAEFGGDDVKGQPRSFALLTYDTPDGNFKPVWDQFEQDLEAEGITLAARTDYFLDLAKAQEEARGVITKLKRSGATSIIFSGDPFMPIYFTQEATAQDYFPEWVMAGTVYADTNVFGRRYDQEQWKHAMGIGLIGTRVTQPRSDAAVLWKWYFGTEPPAENTAGIIEGNVRLLYTGLTLAGPDLDPEHFGAGLYAQPVADGSDDPDGLRSIVSWDNTGAKGIWEPSDFAGLDNAGVIWWDPTAPGKDETGTEGTGMYRLVNGGQRFLPGEWPTEPLPLFDPAGTSTEYVDDIPASLVADPDKYEPPT